MGEMCHCAHLQGHHAQRNVHFGWQAMFPYKISLGLDKSFGHQLKKMETIQAALFKLSSDLDKTIMELV